MEFERAVPVSVGHNVKLQLLVKRSWWLAKVTEVKSTETANKKVVIKVVDLIILLS